MLSWIQTFHPCLSAMRGSDCAAGFLQGIVCCCSIPRRVACYRCFLGMDKLFLTAMDEASIGLMLSADQQL